MKLLSWDVGIYNLSYCILEKKEDNTIEILDWNIINLVDNEEMKKNRSLIFENIPRKLHEIPQLLNVDYVVIENQPSLKNPQMKSIQMILYSYFLILGKVIGNGENSTSYINSIDFCSASNKLKIYDGPVIILEKPIKRTKKNNKDIENQKIDDQKIDNNQNIENQNIENQNIENQNIDNQNTDINKTKKNTTKNTIKYADKKKLAIEHAKYFLKDQNPSYLSFFNDHKKKDDLSDSFLQGLYYIKKNIKFL
jgi:hypothetical protein